MNWKGILGVILILLPWVAMFVLYSWLSGWQIVLLSLMLTLMVFAFVGGCTYLGIELLKKD